MKFSASHHIKRRVSEMLQPIKTPWNWCVKYEEDYFEENSLLILSVCLNF